MKRNTILLLLLLLSLGTFGVTRQEIIIKANKAYSAGAYAAAAEQYLLVVRAGYESPELYYNLGNAYFKVNDMANAILWYERAKRLDPGNEDIDFNLNVANTKISDKIEPIPELFYKRWYKAVIGLLPVDTWAFLGIGMLVAGLLAAVLYLVSRVLILRKLGFWSSLAFLVLAFTALVFAWSSHRIILSASEAVVFAPTITVKSSPDDKSTDLFVVHEGTRVTLLDNISGWYEIRIANGSVGWLPVTSLEKI